MEGKTLINIIDKLYRINGTDPDGVVRTRFSPVNDTYELNKRLTTGTWTFYNMTDKAIHFVCVNQSNAWVSSPVGRVEPKSCKTVTLDSSVAIVGADFQPSDGWSNSDLNIYNESMVMVVEGEHSFMSYFKGVCSIGQDDSIEIITRYPSDIESSKKIKLDISYQRANANTNDGAFVLDDKTSNAISNLLIVDSGRVQLSRNGHIMLYDRNMKFIKTYVNAETGVHDCKRGLLLQSLVCVIYI